MYVNLHEDMRNRGVSIIHGINQYFVKNACITVIIVT